MAVVTIGSHVIALHSPSYGIGIIVDISAAGLLRVIFEDDYDDWFHAQELENAMGAKAAT